MLNEGIYIAENNDGYFKAYKIKIYVKETEKAYKFKLIDLKSRYAAHHIESAFDGKDNLTIKKDRSKHAMCIWDDYSFTIYPFRAGVPYYFKLVQQVDNKTLREWKI